MKIWLLIAICVISMFSCSEEEDAPMPEDQFVEILTDMYLADAMVAYELGKDMDQQDIVHGYYKSVYEKHDITEEVFEEAFDYYSSDLERMKGLLKRVEQNILRQEEANKLPQNNEE